MHNLIESVFEEDPPPCERGGRCRYYERCKHEELACDSFYGFVVGAGGKRGKPLSKDNPTHEIFVKVMASSGEKKEKIKAKEECENGYALVRKRALKALSL